MSNNKLTNRRIAEILTRAEICDDSVLTDYADIAAVMRELQERRRLGGVLHAVCEVCGVPCNNPNHPQMAVAHEYSAPLAPEEMPKGLAGQIVSLLAHNVGDKFLAQKIWNACRAAMLSKWITK
ncbi:hypothetical protein Q4667_002436 [Salmonella enterica]|nr:hypothetical protein [Salmonella enterica]